MTDCICKGNWRKLVSECEPLFGKMYKGYDDQIYSFFGLVHAYDDYYYGMYNVKDKSIQLLSCVGSIEGFLFEEVK